MDENDNDNNMQRKNNKQTKIITINIVDFYNV